MSVLTKLAEIQYELVAPKGQFNKFGNYKFRNCEDILEAVKPHLHKQKCLITLSDEIVAVGEPVVLTIHTRTEEITKDKEGQESAKTTYTEEQRCHQRFYTKATATIIDLETGETHSVTADAREEETKKGMDGSQITGSSSSYARKYALGGLLALDDNKDSDTTNKGDLGIKEVHCNPILYAEYERKYALFEKYVKQGKIKQESFDKLKARVLSADSDEAYRSIISKMDENLADAEKK